MPRASASARADSTSCSTDASIRAQSSSFAKALSFLNILPHVNVLVEVYKDWIRFLFNVVCDAIFYLLFFGLVRTENTIPYNKRSTVVFVDIFFLRAMMHPVVGWSGKNVFNSWVQFSNIFCMYPKLEKYCYLIYHKKYNRVKAN